MTVPAAPDYEMWVGRVADAIHETCRLEWQAIAAVDPGRLVTQHMADAHYGQAHDLVRRLNLAAVPAALDVNGPDCDCDCHTDPDMDSASCDHCTGMSEQERAALRSEEPTE